MPVVLYGTSFSSPCSAVLLTARVLGVDIELKSVDLEKNENRTEAYMKMNPTHTIPTLDDDGFYIWESRAIMGYLVQQYGGDDHLYPKDPKKRALVDNMLYFDADCLYASASQYYLPVLDFGKPADPSHKAVVIERLGFLDTILGQRPYAAGDRLTIADFSLICSLPAFEALFFDLTPFDNIKKWSAKVKTEIPFYDEVTKEGIDDLKAFFSRFFSK